MATQQPGFTRNPPVARHWPARWARKRPSRSLLTLLELAALFILLLVGFLGQPAQTQAASARPHDNGGCPTWYHNGTAGCQGTFGGTIPGGSPPPGPIDSDYDYWWQCVSTQWLSNWVYSHEGLRATFQWDYILEAWGLSTVNWPGDWYVLLTPMPGPPSGDVGVYFPTPYLPSAPNFPYDYAAIFAISSNPNAWPNPIPHCKPLPPCTNCTPQVWSANIDFFNSAPRLLVGGYADCPGASPPQHTCPPSVGNPVTFWVAGPPIWPNGQQTCQSYTNYANYDNYTSCLRWVPSTQVSPQLLWSFDDETVDATTGAGRQVSGVNINVDGGRIPLSGESRHMQHTFQYSSEYDPINRCLRSSCPGQHPVPGYPNLPAFQVKVVSNWDLQVRQFASGPGYSYDTGWRTVNLQQMFGSALAPFPWYEEVTVIPVYVVSDGSVVSP